MAENVLADKLRAGQILLGLCNMYPASGIIESMALGWDFIWIDAQHTTASALHAIQTAESHGLGTLLRVPGHEYGILGPFADLNPSAVMVPMIDTADDARRIVDALRFPPLGKRSYGGRRAIDVGGRDYFRETELLVVAQIETLEGSANARAIINTEGIDCLFFGPDDMKVCMDLPINTSAMESEPLRDAMAEAAQAARAAWKYAATAADSPALLQCAIQMGYQLLVGGGDNVFLRTLGAERLAELRNAINY